jgi:RimJ/RimL family protein N-acetyltransferase
MRAVYLTGERLYLRAMMAADVEHAQAWFHETYPMNAARAKAVLEEQYKGWPVRRPRYVIARVDGDEIVGGVVMDGRDGRRCRLEFHMAPWLPDADAVRAEVLGLLVPKLRDEVELMVVGAWVAADQPATIAAAEAAGMVVGARLREFVARPGGARADLLLLEALNPRWEVRDA